MRTTHPLKHLAPYMSWRCFFENIAICLLYMACARVSQLYAIDPGNVTPVWIPSGVMLALALLRGSQIWPGVFFGAFFGNIWAYFSLSSIYTFFAAIGAASLNGLGDVISTVIIAAIITRFCGDQQLIRNEKSLAYFLSLGVFLGPLASAVFGVGGLRLFGHISTENFHNTFITWWVGDGTGVIIFTPFLLAWLTKDKYFDRRSQISMLLTVPYSLIIAALVFDVVRLNSTYEYLLFLFLPIFFITLFRHGQRQVYSIQIVVLCFAIIATSKGYGNFAEVGRINALLKLQSFAAALSLVLFTIAILNLEKTRNEEKLEKRTIELEELYRKDALTNLWNRYRISEFLEVELRRFKRTQKPFGVLMLDIDDFKKINDDYGHLKGDNVLVNLSELVASNVRSIDLVGRWGGEEFIIIVSDTHTDALHTLANKLVDLVAEHTFLDCHKVTVSIGMAVSTEGDSELTLLDRADAALNRAKNNGKNQSAMNQS